MAPYEKVYIHNIKAMNYLMMGRPDAARMEVQRAINRHRLIKENTEFKAAQPARQKASVKRQAQKNQIENPDLGPEVRRLTRDAALTHEQQRAIRHLINSYENGYTYLLSTLIFGLNKEPENARPRLKNANALTDNRYVKRLFRAFQRNTASLTSTTNLYVFAQVGFAPTKENLQLPFYNPVSDTDIRAWNLAPKKVLFFCGTIGTPHITLRVTDTRGHAVDRKVDITPERLNIVSMRCFGQEVFVHGQAFDRTGS